MTKEQLKLLRLYHGLTQEQFAESLGVGKSTISKIEADMLPISDTMIAKVLRKYALHDKGFLAFCERMEAIGNESPL